MPPDGAAPLNLIRHTYVVRAGEQASTAAVLSTHAAGGAAARAGDAARGVTYQPPSTPTA